MLETLSFEKYTQSNILPQAMSIFFIHRDLKVDVSGICDMELC